MTAQRRYFHSLQTLEEDLSSTFNSSGRWSTKFSKEEAAQSRANRRLNSAYQIPELFNAHFLWDRGYTGTGIKVAVFDTGLRANHPHFKNVVEITNWTDEGTTEDGLGHGTFVTGVTKSFFF